MQNRIEKINYYIDLIVLLQKNRFKDLKDFLYIDFVERYVSRGFIGMFFEDINLILTNEELDLVHKKIQLKLLNSFNKNNNKKSY